MSSPVPALPADRSLADLLTEDQRTAIEALPLFVHQRDFLEQQLASTSSHLLAGEPGTGKTLVAIGLSMAVTAVKRPLSITAPAIYAMPANLLTQVAREFRRFAPNLRAVILRTGKDAVPAPDAFDVLFISYTLPVASRRIAEAIASLAPYALLVCDESHLLRNVKAKRTRFWINLTRCTRWTLMMSGTPLVNSPEDLFTTCFALDLLAAPGIGRPDSDGKLRATTFNEFCSNFVVYGLMSIGGRTFTKPAAAKNADVLNAVLATRTTRWIATELLSLPQIIHGQHYLDIPDVLDTLLGGEIEPSPAMLRLRDLLARRQAGDNITEDQIGAATAAVSQLELSTYRRAIGATKAPGVAEMVAGRLEAGGAPTLVFGHHREALDTIRAGLDNAGVCVGLIYGSTPPIERDRQEVQSFQNGTLNVLVLQIDVAGLGLNLQRAGYVTFGELPWTSAAFEQAIARAHRVGQRQHVLVEIVTVPDSLDEIMIKTIRRKSADAHAVLDQRVSPPARSAV